MALKAFFDECLQEFILFLCPLCLTSDGLKGLVLMNASRNQLVLPLSEGNLKAKLSECFKESIGFAFV